MSGMSELFESLSGDSLKRNSAPTTEQIMGITSVKKVAELAVLWLFNCTGCGIEGDIADSIKDDDGDLLCHQCADNTSPRLEW